MNIFFSLIEELFIYNIFLDTSSFEGNDDFCHCLYFPNLLELCIACHFKTIFIFHICYYLPKFLKVLVSNSTFRLSLDTLGNPVERSSVDFILRLFKDIFDPFLLKPSNIFNNSVLTRVPPERLVGNHVGAENA